MLGCHTRRGMWHAGVDVTTPEQGNLDQDDDRLVHDQGRTGALGEPALRGLGDHQLGAFCFSKRAPSSLARRAAARSPSPADTIEPFIRMCH